VSSNDLVSPSRRIAPAVKGGEVETEVQFVPIAAIGRDLRRIEEIHLTHRHWLMVVAVEPRKMIEVSDHPAKVSHTVAGGVAEAPRIYLIDRRRLPPRLFVRHTPHRRA
jgi:hypothetical protein